jgi:hypothetical protein
MAVLGQSSTNPPLIPDVVLTVSTTWSPPYKVKALVRCFGGGGSGGICNTRTGGVSNSYLWTATGGGAGEHAGSILELDPSVTYTIVAGAGGLQKSRSSDGGATGNAGGNTSFAGSGITTITANGGAGGAVTQFTVIADAGTRAGAVGGSGGAGELYRYTGGAGGAITKPANALVSNNCLLSGGGAVGLFNTGFAGGSVTFFTSASDRTIASGGGGINGVGGPVSVDSADGRATWGGSTFGPASNNGSQVNAPGFGALKTSNVLPDTDASEATIDFWNSGSLMDRINNTFTVSPNSLAPPGSGGRGSTQNSNAPATGTAATLFGGGGAWATAGGGFPSYWPYMMGGKFGGGGGAGGMSNHSGTIPCYSGPGGQGGVLIEMLERIT